MGSRHSGHLAAMPAGSSSQQDNPNVESSSTTESDSSSSSHYLEQPKSLGSRFDFSDAVPILPPEVVDPAPDTLEDVVILENPADR